MSGVSAGELKIYTDDIPDEAWVAGAICNGQCDPNQAADNATIVWVDEYANNKEFIHKHAETLEGDAFYKMPKDEAETLLSEWNAKVLLMNHLEDEVRTAIAQTVVRLI